mmetsp:Transcript_23576/g.51123  ORF Transcript_23576/g.51123 Transcript_23576/m.51123 type:complete len:364 (+) Transcript_23576:74-1165(+)
MRRRYNHPAAHQRMPAPTSAFVVAIVLSFSFIAQTKAFIPIASRPITAQLNPVTAATRSKVPCASSIEPEVHESAINFLQSSPELNKKRNDLKERLLNSADSFKEAQIALEKENDPAAAAESAGGEEPASENDDRYVFRLVKKIVSKISRRKSKSKSKDGKTAMTSATTSKSILSRDKFRTEKLDTGEEGNAVMALAEELVKLNPTPVPTYGFGGYNDGSPSDCKLGGQWKLRFTTAADATFSESPKRGKTSTSQEIDCAKGTLTNVVDFERGKLDGFRVVVAGEAVSDKEIDLTFRKVEILRKSRFPKLFGKLSFRLPSKLIRRLSSDKDKRGPYLTLLYLDDDLRIHRSGTGNLFVQSRIE